MRGNECGSSGGEVVVVEKMKLERGGSLVDEELWGCHMQFSDTPRFTCDPGVDYSLLSERVRGWTTAKADQLECRAHLEDKNIENNK